MLIYIFEYSFLYFSNRILLSLLLSLLSLLPSSSDKMASSPSLFSCISPRKPLRSETKRVILNVYCKLRELNPHETIKNIAEQCASYTGASAVTVHRIKAETKEHGKPNSPRRCLFTPARKRPTRLQKYDSFVLSGLRRLVHTTFFAKNEYVTAAKVSEALKSEENLPNLSPSTVKRLLIDMGFVYKRRKRDSMLIDRLDIIQWRAKYLRTIKDLRNKGKKIYYVDETWVNAGHHSDYVWQDTTVQSSQQAFSENLTTGLKAPSGKGQRLILTHAGSDTGFVVGAADIFIAKKTDGDYHDEMNGPYYEKWFKNKLLPNIEPGSVIVMDNASYHSVKVEKIPTMSMKKEDIQKWLTSKSIEWFPKMTKKELIKLVAAVRHLYDAYRIDTMAEKAGHMVVRLPPYHCELNAIELIWALVKGWVAKQNHTYKMKEVLQLTEQSLSRVTAKNWEDCVKHTIKEEEKMWRIDGLTESNIDSFIIVVDEDETSDEDLDSGDE